MADIRGFFSKLRRKLVVDESAAAEQEHTAPVEKQPLFQKHQPPRPFALAVLFTTLKLLVFAFVVVAFAGLGLVFGIGKAYIETTPEIDVAQLTISDRTSFLYDMNGKLITSIADVEYRDWTDLENIPDMLKNAFIAVEDVRFYKHAGVDFKRLFSAALEVLGNSNSSGGSTITLSKGDFGWKLDEEKMTQLLLSEAQASDVSRFITPVWSHKGVSFEAGNDIGDSYVEIDLTNQKVWLYKDGKKLAATECVTGTYGTDRQTPGGVYSIYYRQSPAVLRGPGYASPVQYWMAFNGGIGLHDANWRSTFGGDIYKTNGSHGCVNLPTEAAKKIYTETYIGYPVVCYN